MKITVSKRSSSAKLQPLKTTGAIFNDKLTPIVEFLKHNYRIEIDKYDSTRKRIASTGTKIYQFPPSLDDISLHMVQEGIPHTTTIVNKILKSPNYTNVYDPIKEYFTSIAEMPAAESHIDRLISHLTIREWGDRPDGFYTAAAARYIRKWLVNAAACATQEHANEAALVFVSEREGNGKTSLARFLCPVPLRDLTTVSHADHRIFSLDQAVTGSFMVLYDEMYGLSASAAEEFKTCISAQRLPIKLRGDYYPIVRPRIGSVIGTSNNRIGHRHGFLYPALGTRRFISIYVDEIDFSYLDDVDLDMLWAEALALSRNPDYDFKYSQADFAELQELNQRYVIDTPASILLQQRYRLPAGDDHDVELMNASEILDELRREHLIKSDMLRFFTPKHIGEAMTKLGFARQKTYGTGERLYKYSVVRINA